MIPTLRIILIKLIYLCALKFSTNQSFIHWEIALLHFLSLTPHSLSFSLFLHLRNSSLVCEKGESSSSRFSTSIISISFHFSGFSSFCLQLCSITPSWIFFSSSQLLLNLMFWSYPWFFLMCIVFYEWYFSNLMGNFLAGCDFFRVRLRILTCFSPLGFYPLDRNSKKMFSFSSFVLKIDTLWYAIVCTWRVFFFC